MRIVLVRHGETLGESSIRLNGATDVALSPLGVRQMERTRDALAGQRFDRVLASPLRRSRDGAMIVAGRAPEVVEDLREVHFGRWEGLTWAEAEAIDPQRVRERDRPDFVYPEGEARPAFRARVAAATQVLTASPRGAVLAVLHKGVIKSMIGALVGLGPAEVSALPCSLGGISELVLSGSWRFLRSDETGHLGVYSG